MFLFSRRKKNDDQPVDPNGRSEKLGIKYKDLAVLGQLMKQGADLSKPRDAVYYLYFNSRESAEAGGRKAQVAGYSYEVREPLPTYPGRWCLLARRPDAVLDPAGVIAADNLFQGIADRAGAEFDGWEAAVQP